MNNSYIYTEGNKNIFLINPYKSFYIINNFKLTISKI